MASRTYTPEERLAIVRAMGFDDSRASALNDDDIEDILFNRLGGNMPTASGAPTSNAVNIPPPPPPPPEPTPAVPSSMPDYRSEMSFDDFVAQDAVNRRGLGRTDIIKIAQEQGYGYDPDSGKFVFAREFTPPPLPETTVGNRTFDITGAQTNLPPMAPERPTPPPMLLDDFISQDMPGRRGLGRNDLLRMAAEQGYQYDTSNNMLTFVGQGNVKMPSNQGPPAQPSAPSGSFSPPDSGLPSYNVGSRTFDVTGALNPNAANPITQSSPGPREVVMNDNYVPAGFTPEQWQAYQAAIGTPGQNNIEGLLRELGTTQIPGQSGGDTGGQQPPPPGGNQPPPPPPGGGNQPPPPPGGNQPPPPPDGRNWTGGGANVGPPVVPIPAGTVSEPIANNTPHPSAFQPVAQTIPAPTEADKTTPRLIGGNAATVQTKDNGVPAQKLTPFSNASFEALPGQNANGFNLPDWSQFNPVGEGAVPPPQPYDDEGNPNANWWQDFNNWMAVNMPGLGQVDWDALNNNTGALGPGGAGKPAGGPPRAGKFAMTPQNNMLPEVYGADQAANQLLTALTQTKDPEQINALVQSWLGTQNVPMQRYFQRLFPQGITQAMGLSNLYEGSRLNADIDIPGSERYEMGADQVYTDGRDAADWMQYVLDNIDKTQVPIENLRDVATVAAQNLEGRGDGLQNAHRMRVEEDFAELERQMESTLAARGVSNSTVADEARQRLMAEKARALADADLGFYTTMGGERRADTTQVAQLLSQLFGQQMAGSQFAVDKMGALSGAVGQAEGQDLARRAAELQRLAGTIGEDQRMYTNAWQNTLNPENIINQRLSVQLSPLSMIMSALSGTNVAPGTVGPLQMPLQQQPGGGWQGALGGILGTAAGSFLGPFGSAGGAALGRRFFDRPPTAGG